jgi:hypothetical protein
MASLIAVPLTDSLALINGSQVSNL